MAMVILGLLAFLFHGSSCLIRLDWATLSDQVTIRHFSSEDFWPENDPQTVWTKMGQNISCTIDPVTLAPSLSLPNNFNPEKPLKLFTHGFIDTTAGEGFSGSKNTYFVNAWMDRYGGEFDVLLLDWADLAWFAQISSWDDYIYDAAARNSIDVGEFVGRCLAGLTIESGLPGSSLHISGHSLGAHLVGKIGRQYEESSGQPVGRITGLDPAGPRFVDGPILGAIPELNDNILSPESATFVDVIHTNGGFQPMAVSPIPRLGALQQLGHMDFYPDGGSVQTGCLFGQDMLPGGACSHTRSVTYFLFSITELNLFPSQACSTVEECNNEESSGPTLAHMGEQALEGYTGSRQLLYHDITDCHWNYDEHNAWLCVLRMD